MAAAPADGLSAERFASALAQYDLDAEEVGSAWAQFFTAYYNN